ncbi:hypothetical protein J4Q44_G00152440 [Coregonus suidteri]|uniref:Uncharacterized protein n=1 Tax=Coregonus suidteri TaxID=861788 RepID=A0AAN8LL22_9TELE
MQASYCSQVSESEVSAGSWCKLRWVVTSQPTSLGPAAERLKTTPGTGIHQAASGPRTSSQAAVDYLRDPVIHQEDQ